MDDGSYMVDADGDGQTDDAVYTEVEADGSTQVWVDVDNDGTDNLYGEDADGDGNFETVAYDEDGDGGAEVWAEDRNDDGTVDYAEVDANGDGYITNDEVYDANSGDGYSAV